MYISTTENHPRVAGLAHGLAFPEEQPSWLVPRLGDAVPQCIRQPAYLRLLPHFLVPAKPEVGGWVPSGAAAPLSPSMLNPGFIDPADHSLLLDAKLDPALKSLMAKLNANQAPFDREPYLTFRRRKGKVRVALVNLSTLTDLTSPRLAEFDSARQTYAASLSKIAALYAAYQLKFDLNHTAATKPETFTQERLNGLKKIFDISDPLKFEFNDSFRQALDAICENCDATYVMGRLGFTFIASALWQSGLYDCRRGGLWLGSNYGACRGMPRTGWHADPIGHTVHGATALSVANYFTLLVQKRLIDSASSLGMIANLFRNRTHCQSFFENGLRTAGKFGSTGSDPDGLVSKIGIYHSKNSLEYYHEGAAIRRSHNGRKLRYIAAVLTEAQPAQERIGYAVLSGLIQHLDDLVLAT